MSSITNMPGHTPSIAYWNKLAQSQREIKEALCGLNGGTGGTTTVTATSENAVIFPALITATNTTEFIQAIFDGTGNTIAYKVVSTNATILNNAFKVIPTTTWNLLEVELVDDVANNGTGLITPYSELYAVAIDGTRTLIATVDNKGANYTLIGTRRNPNEIGVLAKTAMKQLTLTGTTWAPTETINEFSYAVFTVGNIATPPTFTDTDGVVSNLYEGETAVYTIIQGTEKLKIGNTSVTANAGDIIKIYYTEITI